MEPTIEERDVTITKEEWQMLADLHWWLRGFSDARGVLFLSKRADLLRDFLSRWETSALFEATVVQQRAEKEEAEKQATRHTAYNDTCQKCDGTGVDKLYNESCTCQG